MAIFYFAWLAPKLHYYGDVIHILTLSAQAQSGFEFAGWWRPCLVRGIYHGCFYRDSLYVFVIMELLPHFGVSCELSRDAFVRRLRCDNSEH